MVISVFFFLERVHYNENSHYVWWFQCLNTVFTIHGLQPRDRTAILEVNTIEFFLEEFSWKHSLVPRGENWFCSWPPSWPPWRHVQTNNRGNRTELRHLGGQPFRFHVEHSLWGKTFDCQLVIYIRLSVLHFCSTSSPGLFPGDEVDFCFFFSPYLLFLSDSFFSWISILRLWN